MAGAVFDEVRVSLFVVGAVVAEFWNNSRSATCCIIQYKMLVVGVKGNLGCGLRTDGSMVGSWLDHSNDVLSVLSKFL